MRVDTSNRGHGEHCLPVRWYADHLRLFTVHVRPDDLFLTGKLFDTERDATEYRVKLAKQAVEAAEREYDALVKRLTELEAAEDKTLELRYQKEGKV